MTHWNIDFIYFDLCSKRYKIAKKNIFGTKLDFRQNYIKTIVWTWNEWRHTYKPIVFSEQPPQNVNPPAPASLAMYRGCGNQCDATQQ